MAQPEHPDHPDTPEKLFIFVDGEKWVPPSANMTPHDIIDQATDLDPATHYLVKRKGSHETSYKDHPDTPIALEKADRFEVILVGATPVS